MKPLLLFVLLLGLTVSAVEKVDPRDPKWLQEKKKAIEATAKKLQVVEKKTATHLYRSWVNPVRSVRTPSGQAQTMQVIRPDVQRLQLEQNFSKMKSWSPVRGAQVYEKSKDFDKVLNPLSLRDFNRFIYQRNPSSP